MRDLHQRQADAVRAVTILTFWVLPCIVLDLAMVFASWYASRTLNRRLQGYFQQHPPTSEEAGGSPPVP